MSDDYTLTAAGWPRPIVGGYPIPWVAPAEHLSQVNEGRRAASLGGSICQVCGEGWGYGEDAYGFTSLSEEEDPPDVQVGEFFDQYFAGEGDSVLLLDGAMMHMRCAKLAAVSCPHIRDRRDLIFVKVPANEAIPRLVAPGRLHPTYDPGDVQVVAWPTPRRTS